jgi:PleD family two-component response regulator
MAGVTISIGVSSIPSVPMDDAGDMLTAGVQVADTALYVAKAEGRNRVVVGGLPLAGASGSRAARGD